MVRARRRGRALGYRAATFLRADGAGPIGRPPGPSGGSAPCPLGLEFGPPLRGALLQHQLAPPQSWRGHGPQLCPLTTACPLIAGALPPSPLTVSGGQPTAYRALPGGAVSPGRMYGPRGPRFDPWGPCRETTKPHADDSSMRFGSPGGRALYNRSGVTGLSWIYRDYSLCGCHSACRYHRHHQHTISVWLCQALFFDPLHGPRRAPQGPAEWEPGQGPGAPGAGPGRRRRRPQAGHHAPPPPPRPPAPRRGSPRPPAGSARRNSPRRVTTPPPGRNAPGSPGAAHRRRRPELLAGKQNICFVQAEGAARRQAEEAPGADRPLGRGTKRIFCLRRRRAGRAGAVSGRSFPCGLALSVSALYCRSTARLTQA